MPGSGRKYGISFLRSGLPFLITVIIVFSLGLVLGAVSVNRLGDKQAVELSQYMQGFVQQIGEIEPDSQRMARNALINGSVMVTAIYLLGLTVIGMPIVLAILFARGFVLGFAVGFLIRDLEAGGVLLALVSVVPHNMLYVPALLIGVASSLSFGLLLLRRNFNSNILVWPNFIRYTGIMALVLVVVLGAGVVEVYVTPWFTKLAADVISANLSVPGGS